MAVEFTYGTIGSGKTYRMIAQTLDDLQDGYNVATINLNLRLDNCLKVLTQRGVQIYEARRRLGNIQTVFTSPHFRQLRDVRLKVDEAHFWWPQNQYRKIDFEDILTAAMSRKRKVDIHIISQLDKSVNQNIRELAFESWLARPVLVLSDLLKIGRRLGLPLPPMLFEYIRMESLEGTVQRRKDGSIPAHSKQFLWLNLAIASCYDTLQEVSSPTLDEIRDQSRQSRLLAILKGETRPQALCEVCGGSRELRMVVYPVEVGGSVHLHREPYNVEVLRRNTFARETWGECPACDGRGYWYDPNHPDYAEAERLAEELGRYQGRARRAASA
jgi:hypothetical protein